MIRRKLMTNVRSALRAGVSMTLCVSALTWVGCRSGGGFDDKDMLLIEELDGDFALGRRFEDGVRVTDVSFAPVYFSFDRYQIDAAQEARIQEVAAYLRRQGNVRLVIEGHCDERGSREYNLSLGEHRALAVRAYLIGLGIPADRIQTRSYGKERPAAPGHNEEAWRLNRRAEFVLYR